MEAPRSFYKRSEDRTELTTLHDDKAGPFDNFVR